MASVPTLALAARTDFLQRRGMARAEEIRDRESLAVWLNGQPPRVAVIIAHRVAMRVAPVIWARPVADGRNGDLTSLPVLRCCSTSQLAGNSLTSAIRGAADIAASVADAAADKASGVAGPAATEAAAYAAATAADAINAVLASNAAAAQDAVADAVIAATQADFALVNVDLANAPIARATGTLWREVRRDAACLEGGKILGGLWGKDNPLHQAWDTSRSQWQKAGWNFWIKWYEDALDGKEPDWNYLEQVALIPDDIWQQGPDAVAEAIEKLEKNGVWDAEGLRTEDNLPPTHRVSLEHNARVIRLQLDTMRVFVEDEIERLRGANSLSSREHEVLTLRLERLAKIVGAVALMREAFEEDAPGNNALTVVDAQLPAVVEAADKAVVEGEAPEISAAIVSMATTIKYLTDAGAPGHIATGIAFADWSMGKIKGWPKMIKGMRKRN